jgi:hypothetical protein
MARQKRNSVMHNTRGMFNKQVVFNERAGKIYITVELMCRLRKLHRGVTTD